MKTELFSVLFEKEDFRTLLGKAVKLIRFLKFFFDACCSGCAHINGSGSYLAFSVVFQAEICIFSLVKGVKTNAGKSKFNHQFQVTDF